VQCNVIERQKDGLITRLKKAQENDNDVKKILDQVKSGQFNDFTVKNGLHFKEVDGNICIVVPKSMQSQIIRQAHERGHFSIAKTEALLRRDYWIPNIKNKIEKIIKNCIACILAEKKQGKQEGFLNRIEKGSSLGYVSR